MRRSAALRFSTFEDLKPRGKENIPGHDPYVLMEDKEILEAYDYYVSLDKQPSRDGSTASKEEQADDIRDRLRTIDAAEKPSDKRIKELVADDGAPLKVALWCCMCG